MEKMRFTLIVRSAAYRYPELNHNELEATFRRVVSELEPGSGVEILIRREQ